MPRHRSFGSSRYKPTSSGGSTPPCPTNPFDFCIGQWGDVVRDNNWRSERWFWNQLDARHPTQYHLLTDRGVDCCHIMTFCWKDYNPGINDLQRPEHFADQISEEHWEEKISKLNDNIDRAHCLGSYCRGFWMALIPCTLCFSCVCVQSCEEGRQICGCCCPDICELYQKKHVFKSLQPICEEISDEKLVWKPIYKNDKFGDGQSVEYLRLEVKLRHPIEPFEPVRLLPEKAWDKRDLKETKKKLGTEKNSCIMQLLGVFCDVCLCGLCFKIPAILENVEINEPVYTEYYRPPSCVCFSNVYEVGLDKKGHKTVFAPPTFGSLCEGAQVTKAPDCTKKGVLDDGCAGIVEKGPDTDGKFKVRVASKNNYDMYTGDQLVVVALVPPTRVVGGPSSTGPGPSSGAVGIDEEASVPAVDGPASDTDVLVRMEQQN
jgi:hypothetical protein